MNQSDCYWCRSFDKKRTLENTFQLNEFYEQEIWNKKTLQELLDIKNSVNGQQVHRDCLRHFRNLERMFHHCNYCVQRCPHREEIMVVLDRRYDSTDIEMYDGEYMIKQLPCPWQFNSSSQQPMQQVVPDDDDEEMSELEDRFRRLNLDMDVD